MPIKKKRPSLKSSARQREQSSTRDAHSRNSAKRKSEKQNVEQLRIATPSRSNWLSQSGLIVPDDLDPGEEAVNLDFTSISDRAVGAIHSRFAVRHAHALYVRAGFATEILRLKRKQRLALAKFRVRNERKYRTDKALVDAFVLTDKGGELDKALMKLEVKAEILDAVTEGFLDIVKAASREMARRDSERSPRD